MFGDLTILERLSRFFYEMIFFWRGGVPLSSSRRRHANHVKRAFDLYSAGRMSEADFVQIDDAYHDKEYWVIDEKLFEEAVKDLKRHEGLCLEPYHDSEGYLTIGYGTLLDKITEEEAAFLLRHRCEKIMKEVDRNIYVAGGLPYWPRRAIINMAYNLGYPRLRGFKKMWNHLGDENWEKAADEALDSKWALQVGKRAREVAAMIRQGEKV